MSTIEFSQNEKKWLHPNDVLKLQRLKIKKKQLSARIKKINHSVIESNTEKIIQNDSDIVAKRKNPFIKDSDNKRVKWNVAVCDDSSDQTLFQLLHISNENNTNKLQPITFNNILEKSKEEDVKIIESGKTWIPIDWSLKSKMRLLALKPFPWNQKLKISEEASGITAFVRCLDCNSRTTLDTSPNAKFHQCCLYWQHPSLPWLNLFPRLAGRTSIGANVTSTSYIRESLHRAWTDSLRSLFQLVRTRQCPYFYFCANTFTVLFRAVGICGSTEMNALITPTTRGFRQLLRQEDIEFTMPLKCSSPNTSRSPTDAETNLEEDEVPEEEWLESMGISAEDIKQINYTQAKLNQKNECEIDNTDESLVLIEGMEVHALYNFLLNCKSMTSITGPLANIPPTLIAPVAFHGANLSSLKVRESKVLIDESNYYSLELTGPILPHVVHNLCELHPPDQGFNATFINLNSTIPFTKVKGSMQSDKENQNSSGVTVFGKENLSDSGLTSTILKHFCSSNTEYLVNFENLKYNHEKKTYTWV